MTWRSSRGIPFYESMQRRLPFSTIGVNEFCFIRKQHECGKALGASKSCFVACPTDESLETVLALISEKLSKVGVEPIIAIKERAYGQDIFCTKICGRIIESRFCIVILDDTIIKETTVPNPNVYYEYGLMTSLRKHIIPLQKENLKLAFNIQSYDTIKYGNKNISAELDRAIRDALKIANPQELETQKQHLSDKKIIRRTELAGFETASDSWFLADVIDDTQFRGFSHSEKQTCLYLGRIDSKSDFQNYLEDLGIAIYRTDKKHKELEALQAKLKEKLKNKIEMNYPRMSYESQKERELPEIESRLRRMNKVFVGFVISPSIDGKDFEHRANAIVAGNERYEVVVSSDDRLVLGDITIDFTETIS